MPSTQLGGIETQVVHVVGQEITRRSDEHCEASGENQGG
jgi:hypothetical protein